MPRTRTDSLTAQNTFSSPIALKKGGVLTLSNTFTATVTLQRKDGSTWRDVTNNSGTATQFTTAGTYTVSPIDVRGDYRWGVKTGDFTSGQIDGTFEGQ